MTYFGLCHHPILFLTIQIAPGEPLWRLRPANCTTMASTDTPSSSPNTEDDIPWVRSVLEKYNISWDRGFHSDEVPLTQFEDPYFHVWDEICKNLHIYIEKRSLRDVVNEMPLLDHTKLKGWDEWMRAHMILAVMASGYVWQNGKEEPAKAIPKCLAVPLAAVSEYIGCRPVLSYPDLVFSSWKINDKTRPLDRNNVTPQYSFTGDKQEQHFLGISFQIEIDAAPGIRNLLTAQKAVKDKDAELLKKSLTFLSQSIDKMKKTFTTVYDGCSTECFSTKFSRFFGGWEAKVGLPDGLIFEGVSSEPIQCKSVNASQTLVFQLIDYVLGLEHPKWTESGLPYEENLQTYWTRKSREFLKFVKSGPSIRKYVNEAGDDELKNTYNTCIESLKQFRNFHIQAVTSYVVIPAKKREIGEALEDSEPLERHAGMMAFLKAFRDETKDHKLESG